MVKNVQDWETRMCFVYYNSSVLLRVGRSSVVIISTIAVFSSHFFAAATQVRGL